MPGRTRGSQAEQAEELRLPVAAGLGVDRRQVVLQRVLADSQVRRRIAPPVEAGQRIEHSGLGGRQPEGFGEPARARHWRRPLGQAEQPAHPRGVPGRPKIEQQARFGVDQDADVVADSHPQRKLQALRRLPRQAYQTARTGRAPIQVDKARPGDQPERRPAGPAHRAGLVENDQRLPERVGQRVGREPGQALRVSAGQPEASGFGDGARGGRKGSGQVVHVLLRLPVGCVTSCRIQARSPAGVEEDRIGYGSMTGGSFAARRMSDARIPARSAPAPRPSCRTARAASP